MFFYLFTASSGCASGAFPLDDASSILIGHNLTYTIRNKETLITLAREYGVGYAEIADANSHVDPWVPAQGSKILLPTSWLLPEILEKGILIKLA